MAVRPSHTVQAWNFSCKARFHTFDMKYTTDLHQKKKKKKLTTYTVYTKSFHFDMYFDSTDIAYWRVTSNTNN